MANSAKPLVIVGAGFAGTATLLHMILRASTDPAFSPDSPMNIALLERAPLQLYGGIAYGQTPKHEYNLNLSAKRVTPFAEGQRPEGFPSMEEYIDQLAASNPETLGQHVNTSRQLYGQYLRYLVDIAIEQSGGKVNVETIYDQAIDLHEDAKGATIELESGRVLDASRVILATGFKEAVSPAFAFNAASSPRYLDYPYSEAANGFFDRLIAGPDNTPESTALVIGTGLSAMDSANRLLDNGYQGKITMLSRRGMMHAIYRQMDIDPRERLQGEPRDESELPLTEQTPDFITQLADFNSFDDLFGAIRKEMFQRVREGNTTEEILSHWEKFVPQVYQKFPEDTREFLLNYETAINVFRVGTTPELADKILDAKAQGRLEIKTGRIENMVKTGNGFDVTWRPNNRHGQRVGADRTTAFTTVINGIGNSTKYDLPAEKIQDPLWSNLRARNAYTVHPSRDGVAVTDDFDLIDGKGVPYKHINVIGVPVSGHMNVTAYPYPEKAGEGARLGAFTLNIQGILGGVLALVDREYDAISAAQASPPAPLPATFRPDALKA